jgi:lipid-binding SYLF domain-containing protein
MRKLIIAGALILASSVALNAAMSRGEERRLRDAADVLHELHESPDKDIPQDLWDKAACVVVIPSVKKAAFVFGGEYGKGVMSCRTGGWTAPAFMMLAKGSVGFQIGGEAIDLVLLVMNDHGMKHLLQDKVALGGEASIAGGPVGRDARAMTDAQLKAEILSYSRSQGLFAGIDLTGGVLKPDLDANEDAYGRGIRTADIVERRTVTVPPQADAFMRALRRAPIATTN